MSRSALDWLLPLLVCPVCGSALAYLQRDVDGDGVVGHEGACAERYPVIDGVPRLLVGPFRREVVGSHGAWFEPDPLRRELAERWAGGGAGRDAVVRDFDYEWAHFPEMGTEERGPLFESYFDLVPAAAFTRDAVALDCGAGSGRWAREVVARGPRVIAMDLGLSIERLARSARDAHLACVQADIGALPIADGAVDWAYCLGVLHHIARPAEALGQMRRATKPGGFVLAYVYYALEGRPIWYRSLFAIVDRVRRTISHLPRPAARAVADLFAVTVYWPLARSAGLAMRLGASGLANTIPLSFYRDTSLRTMRNDALDRFGTKVERRFTRTQLAGLLGSAGLRDVTISDREPYWHALGRAP